MLTNKDANVQDKIIHIRNENVILDSDVAGLYGVETKRINEAVKNNRGFGKQFTILGCPALTQRINRSFT